MSLRSRSASLVGIAAVAAIALTGCSTASSSDAVSYWGAFYAPATETAFQEIFVDTFNADAEVGVEMEVKELTTLGQQTKTAVAAGQAADILYSDGPSTASDFARSGHALSLEKYAAEYGWKDKFLPWAYELSTVDGELKSIPTGYGSMVLYYNPEVFDENGWTPPTTRAEMETIMAEASAQGMVPLGGGNAGYQAMSEWLLTAVLNAAVGPDKLYDVLTGEASFTDPEFVDAIDMIDTWLDNGWLAGGREAYFTTDDTANATGLATGTTAMYITGTWSFNSMTSVFGEAEWDWAPLPSLSDDVEPGVYPLAIGTALSINAKSTKPDAAAAFLNHIVGDTERALSYTARSGENPPPLALDASEFGSEIDERTVRLYSNIPATTNVGYATWTFFPPATNAHMWMEFDKIVTGAVSVADYLAGVQEKFDADFTAGTALTPFTPAGR